MRIFFPKLISTDEKCTFDNIIQVFGTQFLKERLFHKKGSSAHLECNSDNTRRQRRGHSSRKKFGDTQNFFLDNFPDN